MVAYSFKSQFIAPIAAGTKRQTIRTDRRRHARPGEQLQLYTAMRTKHCRLIGRACCLFIEPIRLQLAIGQASFVELASRRRLHHAIDLDAFARMDGFADWPEMVTFWRAEHDALDMFTGWRIGWRHPDVVLSDSDRQSKSLTVPGLFS